jgi:translation initiation factor IF-2
MSTVRVDELASELGLSPDELFSQLKAMGFDVVNVTSSVDLGLIDMVRDVLEGQKPRERDTSAKRRIVSVRKGEKEPEVEVRLEEEEEPEEGLEAEEAAEVEVSEPAEDESGEEAAEPEEVEEAAAEEAEAETEVTEPGEGEVETGEEAEAAEGGEAAETAVAEAEGPEPVEGETTDEEAAAAAERKKIAGISISELEKKKGIVVGSEIPTAKVVEQAKAEEELKPAAPGPGSQPEKTTEPEKKRKKGKAAAKKSRKPSRQELMEVMDEEGLDNGEVTEAEEPTLKVVEIKHTGAPPQMRRKEQQVRGRKGRKPKKKQQEEVGVEEAKPVSKTIRITAGLTVGDLAGMTGTKASEIIKVLLQLGQMATINQTLDPETAGLVVDELGFEVEMKAESIDDLIQDSPDVLESMISRAPVITVMGHVDHGKTSLLDAVRETDVVSGEAGGITQHIGAHLVHHKKGKLTFLDTPGHEAFTAMRARGAQVTDLVVLVVAADDGVKPQTIEAIDHAKAAEVPIIVAVNKMDKPEADTDRVMRELSDHGIVAEEWGGDILFVKVSAKQREGIDDLLDAILLQAEMLELSADPEREARGVVIESKLDKGRGAVATVLVQKGTLKPGDLLVAGSVTGRVRAMLDDYGKKQDEAGPSVPVEILGLQGVPQAGESFIVFTDELKAKRVAQIRQAEIQAERASHKKVTLEDLFDQIQQGEIKDLGVVLKADVQGSVEAIREALEKQGTSEVRVRLLHEGTGGINEGDVMLASASNAIIIGFNVRPDNKALQVIRREQVDVRFYNVIYDVVKDIRDALTGLLSPVYHEEVLGRAEIREIFHVPKIGTIAGCYVVDGLVRRNAQVRVVRDGVVVHDGKIDSVRRFKDDVREVQNGYECGIGVENYNDIKPGDILENYEMIEQEAQL